MSEIPANPFQFKIRANTINVNQTELPDFNSKIQQISERFNEPIENFKDLFKFLLDYAANPNDFIENQEGSDDITLKIEELERQLQHARDTYSAHFDRAEKAEKELKQLQDDQFNQDLNRSMEMENVLLVPVSPEQKELLQLIATNRQESDYETDVPGSPDSADSIIKKIAFRECYLRNHYGRFYTGL